MQENIKQVIVKNTVRKEFKTAPIFQYDVGHVLSFEGFDLPEAFEVHFSLTEAGDAVTQVGSNNQVTVPDILVQDGRWLYAWLYISDQETGLTKFTIQIPVTRRARPTDQTPTPVEQSEIQQAIAALNAGVTRAETAAENAETAEENASQSAENAYNSSEAAASAAESAEGDARTATEKAQIAVNAAETATRKAQEASESAEGLAEAVRTAQEAKQTAVNKATEAAQSATNATQKAQEATSAASSASQSATDADTAKRGAESARDAAQGYAGNASTSAQAAETAKDTAVQKAGEASQSATAAAQSAQAAQQTAAQFEEDITELKSDIQANQEGLDELSDAFDEHEEYAENTYAKQDGYYADMTVGNAEQLNSSKFVENAEPYTLRTSGGSSDIGNREYVDAVVGGTVAWNQAVRDSASENSTDFADVVTVTDAVEDAAGVKVKIEPVQDLHGYENPWPAGGGKNLIVPLDRSFTNNGVPCVCSASAETVSLKGTATDSGGRTGKLTKDIVLPAGTYTLSITAVSGTRQATYIVNRTDNNAYISAASFSLEEETSVYVGANVLGGTVYDEVVHIQIEAGRTATDWTPYSNICPITGWDGVKVTVSPTTDAEDGQTYSITLPTEAGTVYGGTLDVSTGELVVDTISVELTGTAIRSNWDDADRDSMGFYLHADSWTYNTGLPNPVEGNGIFSYCYNGSVYLTNNWWAARLLFTSGSFNRFEMRIPKNVLTTVNVAGAKAYLDEHPLQVVYKIAPQTYTLTPTEIRTLLGTNNVWADTGDLALTYTGTDEHLTLESGKKYLSRISGTDSMLLGSGQEITAAKGTDNVFDLTKMFGTAVADYIYGQGAAFFRKWFPNARYSYNAGQLKHVDGLQSHDMVGFNAWDEEWEVGGINISNGQNVEANNRIRSKNYIKCLPGTAYYTKGNFANGVTFFDENKVFLGSNFNQYPQNSVITTPSNASYMRFSCGIAYGATYKHDICINLAHNNSRNGEYEPYEKHSYPLDSTVILRGIPKVGANGVYWDGDRYLPDGTVTRKYGVIDLGAFSWKYNSTYAVFFAKLGALQTSYGYDGICSAYAKYTGAGKPGDKQWGNTGFIGGGINLLVVDSSYTDPATFKAAMQGVLLVYELETPTTETAQPYHSTQWVSDWGTEEFVSTGLVPVGHETRYPANLRDKLQHLPDAANGNGSYLITQTDGQMVLTPFPAPPSTAGNYVLKATVTGGVATYTWEVAT